jgi:Flp pilus assembly protein TadG
MFTRFFRNRDGGVAPFLAIAAIPLMGITGAALDYTRASSARTAMQSALDATALNLSKTAQGLDAAQIQSQAEQVFNALFTRPEVDNVSIQTEFSSPQQGNFVLKITGNATISTQLIKLLGHSQFGFSANSEVLWGIKKLNLALALDNTGSMASDGKMSALKTAAHNLIDTLKGAEKEPGDIKVSIVPFAVDVNAGTGNVAASWIDWSDWEDANGNCSKSSYHSRNSCTNNGGAWTPKNHNVWNGCVNDRDQNNDVTNTPTGAGASTKYRAHQASNCPASMMALSTSWADMHSKIDAMTPAGNTNVTIGLQMAWQTLSNNEPFNAPAPSTDLDKVIILLTDGDNTQNRWTSSSSAIDARTQKACDNVKAANVKLYTVRVINGNATLLKNCATKPDMYYDVDQASELNGVFSSIAQNLANLRIAK